MYLFELITRYIRGKKYKKKLKFDPFASDTIEPDEFCEHIFLPVDSSGEVLACSKCGLIVNKRDMKDTNIFKREQS